MYTRARALPGGQSSSTCGAASSTGVAASSTGKAASSTGKAGSTAGAASSTSRGKRKRTSKQDGNEGALACRSARLYIHMCICTCVCMYVGA